MRQFNYNDENVFNPITMEEAELMVHGYIQIPIYYSIDDDGNVMIDTESILEEFQRTVFGIESVLEELTDKLDDME